jgi:flagellar basal-body rod modification protein FlgD
MSAAAISGVGGVAGPAGGGAFGNIKSEDFIKILVTELANQDPFAPQDSGALLEQLSSLRNIESQLALQEQLQTLVLQNQIAAASGMIGKLVTGLDENNEAVEGFVSSVRVQNGRAVLELNTGKALPMDRVTHIADGSPVTGNISGE